MCAANRIPSPWIPLFFLNLCVFVSGGLCRISPAFTVDSLKNLNFTLPADIQPTLMPAGDAQTVSDMFWGIGVHDYVFNGSQWVKTEIRAQLFNEAGTKVGRHFFNLYAEGTDGGEYTWETLNPGSSVNAKLVVSELQPYSVPHELYQTTTSDGSSIFFGSISYVQRLQTTMGLPPDEDFPATTGANFTSMYSALYAFYYDYEK